MEKVLNLIEKHTNGTCYKSHRYCYETVEMPSVSYDDSDKREFIVQQNGETDNLKSPKNIKAKADLIKNSKPLFKFFLDGSRRTYKIDDIEYGKKIFPIVGGQIGVACCMRENPSKFKKVILENSLALSLPSEANADGNKPELYFNSLTQKINDSPSLKKYNMQFSKILPYESKHPREGEPNFEHKGIAKIHDEMVFNEKSIVAKLYNKNLLNSENYLIKDGTLQYKPMKSGDFRELSKIAKHYQSVVGISKSFNPELCRDRKNRSNATEIAKLKLYERSPAFTYHEPMLGDVKFVIWYLRIRDKQYSASPFDGIVKIEKLLVSETEKNDGLNSDEVDLISANIINERNPVCYGTDNRWANHLYPVYLTEKYLKSLYISDLYFLNLF
jgi:hypothetical protein